VPSRDLFIEKDSSINEHIEQMRLSATKSLLERRDVVIVATVSAIYGIGDPVDYHSMILHLREGEKMHQRDIIRRLVRCSTSATRWISARHLSRARRRDRHLSGRKAESALRITLFDDELESITLFDPLTGHTRQKLGRFTVFPSSHYVTPRATVLKAIEAIKELELRQRIEFFQANQKLVECQRIEQRTRFDLEMLDELGFCKGIENYSRHMSGGRPASRRRR
jgi:excinuclease ABC subunit B